MVKVRDKRKAVVENAGERLKLLVKAFLTDDDRVAAASISKAQLLSSSAPKLLHSIKHYQVTTPLYFYSANLNKLLQNL